MLAPPQRSERQRYASLDFWRGMACLSVVIFHSTLYVATPEFERKLLHDGGGFSDYLVEATSRLWIGVPVFFVISGYCIATIADKSRDKHFSITEYFRRRFRRIYPPYWCCFLAVAGVIAVVEWISPGFLNDDNHPMTPPGQLRWQQWAGNLTLTEPWRTYVFGGPGVEMTLLGVMWTLCYEEQFYFIVGFALTLSRKYFFHVMALISVLVYWNTWEFHPRSFNIYKLTTAMTALQNRLDGTFVDGHWLDFAVGIGVYYWINRARVRWRIAFPMVVILAAIPVMFPLGRLTEFYSSGQQQRLIAVGFGLLLITLHGLDQTLSVSRWARPISRCGVMCYSIYLVHLPVTKSLSKILYGLGLRGSLETLLITVPICMVASLVIARVFFNRVEARFLNRAMAA